MLHISVRASLLPEFENLLSFDVTLGALYKGSLDAKPEEMFGLLVSYSFPIS